MQKNHNEYDIIKVPSKNISNEIRYNLSILYIKDGKKQALNNTKKENRKTC